MNNALKITNEDIEASAPVNPIEQVALAINATLQFRGKADAAKGAAKSAIKAAIEIELASIPGNVTDAKREKALKAVAVKVRESLIKRHGIAQQRVSEVLIEFGLRTRAKRSNLVETSEELEDAIKALIALASETAGDKAYIALRRASLVLKGKQDA
jgi:hypothetical protein